jgi:hypothetical protein
MVPDPTVPRMQQINSLDRRKAVCKRHNKNHSFEACNLNLGTPRDDLDIPGSIAELPSTRSILKYALGSRLARAKSVGDLNLGTESINVVSKNSASRQVGFRQEDIDRKKKISHFDI